MSKPVGSPPLAGLSSPSPAPAAGHLSATPSPLCGECPLQGQKPVRASFVPNPKLCVLVEGPTQQDVAYGKLGSGQGAKILWATLARAGLSEKVDITGALLCRSKRGISKKDLTKAMKCCAPRLEQDLEKSATPIVLALGARSLQALTGKAQIQTWMGAPLPITKWKGTKKKPGNAAVSAMTCLPAVGTNSIWADPFLKPFFTTHVSRAAAMAQGRHRPWQWPTIQTTFTSTEAELLLSLEELAGADIVGLDTETAGLHYHDTLKDVAVASATRAVCIDWLTASEPVKAAVKRIIEGPAKKVMQNGMFDYFVFRANGIHLQNFWWDTTLSQSSIAPRLSKKLGMQMCLYSSAPRFKSDFRAGNDNPWKSEKRAKERALYCAQDAFACLWLATVAHPPQLDKTPHGREQFEDLMAELHIAIKMREHGVWVDYEHLEGVNARLRTAVQIVRDRLFLKVRAAGYVGDFNPDAPAHIRKLFLDVLKSPSRKRTAKGAYSYSADQVLIFAESEDVAIRRMAKLILIFRRFSKLLQANGKLVEFIDEDGRVRPSWNPGGAATRRWACDRPNLQQVAKARKA